MKATALILAVILSAAMCLAQAPGSTGAQPASPSHANAPAAQQNAPAAGQQPTQPATAGQPAAPGQPAGKRPPQAKTPQEMADFNAALTKGKSNVKEGGQAADEFAVKYPDSDLKWILFQQMMLDAQSANDEQTMLDMGRKSIKENPDNALSLSLIAMVLAERTRDTDLDKAEKTAEAVKDANRALETADSMELNVQATPEQMQAVRNQVKAIAYGALGTLDFNDKNDAKAVENLRKAASQPGVPPDPVSSLRLAVALDHLQKYAEALQVTNQALPTAPEPAATQLRQEHDRLAKLTGSPTAPGSTGAAPPPAAASPSGAPPSSTASQPKPPRL